MSTPSIPTVSGQKSKTAVWLLAFFLGIFGAHNFYLGETRNGLYHLALWAAGLLCVWVLSGVAGIFTTIGSLISIVNWGWGMFQAYQASQRSDVA